VLFTSNGYGANYRALVGVISGSARVRAVDANVIDLSPVLRTPVRPERAGLLETSLLLHLAPEAVRRDRVADATEPGSGRLDGTEPVPLPGTSGVIGRPTAATAEKGRRIYEYLVRYIGDRLFADDAEVA
ncbi:MAG: creatininase family protein, partial [Gemmatimonadota bacterium]|nr:creatininase family protein [Gemmatimonadota bacterium]